MIGRTERRNEFRQWTQKLAQQTGVAGIGVEFAEIDNLGHVGAILSLDPQLLETVCDDWIKIRDASLS
jgi:hypothetical protein